MTALRTFVFVYVELRLLPYLRIQRSLRRGGTLCAARPTTLRPNNVVVRLICTTLPRTIPCVQRNIKYAALSASAGATCAAFNRVVAGACIGVPIRSVGILAGSKYRSRGVAAEVKVHGADEGEVCCYDGEPELDVGPYGYDAVVPYENAVSTDLLA